MRVLIALLSAVAALFASAASQPNNPPPSAAYGPLFLPSVGGLANALHLPHYCSASVVDSTGRNLVLTAAHCVVGTGVGIGFAPGYANGNAPYGIWEVRRVYVDRDWITSGNPQHDYALLQIAPRNGKQIEDVAGGHPIGAAPAPDTQVQVTGYVAKSGGSAIECTAPVYETDGYPSFDCAGFADGVSGAPWIANGEVVGDVGGLQQGGCTAATSYSPAFGPDIQSLLARAESGKTGDLVPIIRPSGC